MSGADSWAANLTIWSGFIAWTAAQAIKLTRGIWQNRRIDFRLLFSTGGMPSAHTAMVCAMATSVGLREGFGSAVFAIALTFAAVVMFDAQSVRHAAGQQARLLNQIVDELFQRHHLSETKLVEFLGHTRIEVFAGLLMGIAVALLVHRLA